MVVKIMLASFSYHIRTLLGEKNRCQVLPDDLRVGPPRLSDPPITFTKELMSDVWLSVSRVYGCVCTVF